ncbi:MAG: hypothetical protein JXA68_03655 [Ignavibacteriales bacterium]|nr:hypothetical protein [Ignavibacteriales bacterium]
MQYKTQKQYRLKGFDYSDIGEYFITICTNNRIHYFGEIVDNVMNISDIGKIANKIWDEIPNTFENVKLDVNQIMPEHFHAILAITKRTSKNLNYEITKNGFLNNKIFKSRIKNNPMELNGISLGYIIRWFKGRVKYEVKKIRPDFKWQSRYNDKIIRNEKEYYFIREYIVNNPINWDKKILDEYFKKNPDI